MAASPQFLWMVSGRLEQAPVRPTKAKPTPSRCARPPLPKEGARIWEVRIKNGAQHRTFPIESFEPVAPYPFFMKKLFSYSCVYVV